MALTSVHFVWFFIVTVLLYFALPQRWRWVVLLAASYYFYMCAEPRFALVMLATTGITYASGLLMSRRDTREVRRRFLLAGLAADLGLLFIFKYLDFSLHAVEEALSSINVIVNMPEMRWLVPLGISFYTLQSLSYLFDVYKGKMAAERHPGYLAAYVSFFPTVTAGPIERGAHLIPQLHERHEFSYQRTVYALQLIAWGLFKKLVVADRLAFLVNQVYGDVRSYSGLPLVLATLLFAVQLYADFSGYTDIVRGCASVMGFDILENFNLPYFAKSISEFWRRWHMSMTSWFRDYLYIPLGGNRRGTARTYLNILIVFLASGLWHGASWTFVAWGALHAGYMMVGRATAGAREALWERTGVDPGGRAVGVLKALATFLLVDFAWILFRADSLADAGYIIRNLFSSGAGSLSVVVGARGFALDCVVIALFLAAELVQLRGPLLEIVGRQRLAVRWALYCSVVLSVLLLGVAGSQQFVYVQF